MTIALFIGLYLGAAMLLLAVVRAKNASIPPLVRRLEDVEQMEAVRSGAASRPHERDPLATLS